MPDALRRALVAGGVFLTLAWLRTIGITHEFLFNGEQIRDWALVLGSWRDLPLTGTPSTAGGDSFGPVYYWVLWVARVTIGPFTQNLPHAGGIGIALFQSAADAWLVIAIWKRWKSLPLAVGVVLLIATGPLDLSLSATIWNPAVAVALVKMTMAMVLTQPEAPSLWRIAITSALAWMAVQAHSTGIFVAASVMGALTLQPLIARNWRRAFEVARVNVEVIVLLQLPWLWHQLHAPGSELGPSRVVNSLAGGTTGEASVSLARSYASSMGLTALNLTQPLTMPGALVIVAVVLAIVAWRQRRDLMVLAITLMPLLLTIVGFATWTATFESYWFLTLVPALALATGLAVSSWPGRAGTIGAAVLCAVVLVAVPSRVRESHTMNRQPHYAALVAGVKAIYAQTPVIRQTFLDFEVPPECNEQFLYRLLGGDVTPTAPFVATIHATGEVTFAPAR